MNTTEHNQSNTSHNPQIKWNDFLDVENSDDFEFKILDEGLGFHHKEEAKPKPTRKAQPIQRGLNPSRHLRAKNTEVKLPKVTTPSRALSHLEEVSLPKNLPGALPDKAKARPVQKTKKVEARKDQAKTKIKAKVKTASIEARMAAFILDIAVFAGVLFAYVFMGSFMMGVSVDKFSKIIFRQDYLMFIGSIAFFTYVLYFSLLDCTQTIGKKALNIKVVKAGSQERSNLIVNFMRSILVVTILPIVFGFQDNLSDTKVIECN